MSVNIPEVYRPTTNDQGMRRFVDSVSEAVKLLTKEVNTRQTSVQLVQQGVRQSAAVVNTANASFIVPPPIELAATAGSAVVFLSWLRPTLTTEEVANVSHAEIWRSDFSDFSNPVLLGREYNTYNDYNVEYDDTKTGIVKFYRVRYVSYASTPGAWSDVVSAAPNSAVGLGKVIGVCFRRAPVNTTWNTVTYPYPVGGSFNDPTATGWSDGIPSEDANGWPVWWTSRAFTSTGVDGQDVAWSSPVILSNTSSTKYMYHASTSATIPTLPSTPVGNSGDVSTTNGWTITPSSSAIWAAISTMSNGVWSPFAAYRIKGEKGEPGSDGNDGNDGNDAPVVVSGYIFWSSVTTTPTTNPSGGSVSFDANGKPTWTSYPSGWSLTSPSMSASGGTIYFSIYTVSGQKSSTATPTYTAYQTGWNFASLVTFTDLATSGQTSIHGGNIQTDTITVDSLKTGKRAIAAGVEFGLNAPAQNINWAVYGTHTDGCGVYGQGSYAYLGGVMGYNTHTNGHGVYGIVTGNGCGVIGEAQLSGGTGVSGSSYNGYGVSGSSTNGTGVYGSCGSFEGYLGRSDRAIQATEAGGRSVSLCTSSYAMDVFGNVTINGTAHVAGVSKPFTGAHESVVDESLLPSLVAGDILVDVEIYLSVSISNAITVVELSSVEKQKSAVGVYNPTPTDALENEPISSEIEKIPVIYPYYGITMNSIGEGLINVCGLGGNLEPGDLITTSAIAGKGMKQDDDLVRNYTVAKCREHVTFDYPEQVKQVACIYMCG